jgi:hypothetical protein
LNKKIKKKSVKNPGFEPQQTKKTSEIPLSLITQNPCILMINNPSDNRLNYSSPPAT